MITLKVGFLPVNEETIKRVYRRMKIALNTGISRYEHNKTLILVVTAGGRKYIPPW